MLSGSEQNLDFTGKDWRAVLKNRRGGKAPPSVAAFLEKGEDFVVRDDLADSRRRHECALRRQSSRP